MIVQSIQMTQSNDTKKSINLLKEWGRGDGRRRDLSRILRWGKEDEKIEKKKKCLVEVRKWNKKKKKGENEKFWPRVEL